MGLLAIAEARLKVDKPSSTSKSLSKKKKAKPQGVKEPRKTTSIPNPFKALLGITPRKDENLPAAVGKGVKTSERKQTKTEKKPAPVQIPKPKASKPAEKKISPKKEAPHPVKLKGKVTTTFDELLSAVESKDKLDFKTAAGMFNVSEEKIEQWAKILEDNELLIIKYPPFGRPVMIKKLVKKGNA